MRVTAYAHRFIEEILQSGETALDATVGNGYDTVFLAQCVGRLGHVIGFDIQAEALKSTQKRLEEARLLERVTLHQLDHSQASISAEIGAAMFNLGYLPGGNHLKITQASATRKALDIAWDALRNRGGLSIICYPGHPGGGEEAAAVLKWARGKNAQIYPEDSHRDEGIKPFGVFLRKPIGQEDESISSTC